MKADPGLVARAVRARNVDDPQWSDSIRVVGRPPGWTTPLEAAESMRTSRAFIETLMRPRHYGHWSDDEKRWVRTGTDPAVFAVVRDEGAGRVYIRVVQPKLLLQRLESYMRYEAMVKAKAKRRADSKKTARMVDVLETFVEEASRKSVG